MGWAQNRPKEDVLAVTPPYPDRIGCSWSGGLAWRLRAARWAIRIGFLVKQPEVQWFQDEWRFASRAARDKGFDLLRIGAEDGDRVLSAIDTLYARYAQGFVICTPDPNLGTAIRLRAQANRLKVLAVDDRLLGPDGRAIAAIPYLGISASAIGELAGRLAIAEARRRGWTLGEVGVLRLAFDSLDTGRERSAGAVRAVIAGGVASAHVYSAPQRSRIPRGLYRCRPGVDAEPCHSPLDHSGHQR
jgi:ABC-type sugar transport system substrate-binding protein